MSGSSLGQLAMSLKLNPKSVWFVGLVVVRDAKADTEGELWVILWASDVEEAIREGQISLLPSAIEGIKAVSVVATVSPDDPYELETRGCPSHPVWEACMVLQSEL